MQQLIGLMLDSARCLENRAYYRRAIEFAAARGVNLLLWHFTDDQGCMLAFESVPGIGSPHAYSKSEMRELVAFARARGVTIVPELASLGHSRYITHLPQYKHLDEIEHVFTGMCPVAPETREVLAKLIAETCEVFDSPWIHVGLDEANIGHHPLTRHALLTRSRGDLFADHINFMHDQVRRHGRTMMMWGDGLLADAQVRQRLSREIIVCDWQYHAAVDGHTTQQLLDDGFSVLLCPALISHDQTLFPGDQLAVSNLRSTASQLGRHGKPGSGARVLGVVATLWQPERYLHDALWMAIDLAIAILRNGSHASIEKATARFAAEFHGLDAPEPWIAACRQIYRLSPLRAEWLALLKMDASQWSASAVAGKARQWRQIADTLAAATDRVQHQRGAYRTFVLMTELVAHLYEKATLLTSGRGVLMLEGERVIEQERILLGELDRVWDQERFADDPKKRTAARECFRDNNLLALLHEMHARTEQLLGSPAAASAERKPARAARPVELAFHLPNPVAGVIPAT